MPRPAGGKQTKEILAMAETDLLVLVWEQTRRNIPAIPRQAQAMYVMRMMIVMKMIGENRMNRMRMESSVVPYRC